MEVRRVLFRSAGADEEVRQLRRLAEDEVAGRREAFRAVDELLDAGGLQRRHSAERQLHELLEVIEVGIQQGVVEARRDAVDRPGNGIRLVAAHDEAADLLLVIRSEEHTSELQSLMHISYSVCCLKKTNIHKYYC